MKIAVTGWDGRIGRALCKAGCIPLDCDITKPFEIKQAVKKVKPQVIINCAALTQVDQAEKDYETFLNVNGWAIRNLLDTNLKVIQISTDYIFDGHRGPYNEHSPFLDEIDNEILEPINAYGWSKTPAELLINEYKNLYIVRTTGVYTEDWEQWDFLKMVVANLKDGNQIKVSYELFGNQTFSGHFAEGLLYAIQQDKLPKILHIASKEIISRYEFALAIAKIFGFNNDWSSDYIIPCKNDDVPKWIAKRPTKGGLKIELAESLGIPIYSIEDGLKECLKTYPS